MSQLNSTCYFKETVSAKLARSVLITHNYRLAWIELYRILQLTKGTITIMFYKNDALGFISKVRSNPLHSFSVSVKSILLSP